MSFFNRFDSRSKLFFVFLFAVLVFLVDKLIIAVFMLFSVTIVRLASNVPLNIFKLIRNLTLLAVFVIIIQALFGPGDSYIVKPFKKEGLLFGIMIVCRLAALFIILPVFTETTRPSELTAGLCALGLNYRFAFIITTGFNMIPFFKNEAYTIIEAQKLRGMQVFEREMHMFNKLNKFKAYINLLIPLMLGAMRKAQVLSIAMDSRCFGIYKTRTWTDKPKMKGIDYLFIAVCAVYSICLLFVNYYLGKSGV
ncbi:MAG: energy-coupling factor transporter transmembrane protein EcfT [Treponema sp.]|nr:energy-coupling factor transporter transmembrane protein EcfT [Treponema sp.]